VSPALEARIAAAREALRHDIAVEGADQALRLGWQLRDIHRHTTHAIGEHYYACRVRLGFAALAIGLRMDPPGPIRPRVRAGTGSTA
jgi:hypothetical protein